MGTQVNDRVKKFCAKKKKTQAGTEEMRAQNRLYVSLNRRKKRVALLAFEKQELMTALDPIEQEEVEAKSTVYQHHEVLMALMTLCKDKLNEVEMDEVIIKVMKHEIKLIKGMVTKQQQSRKNNKVRLGTKRTKAQVNTARGSGSTDTQAPELIGTSSGNTITKVDDGSLGSGDNNAQARRALDSNRNMISTKTHALDSSGDDSMQVHEVLISSDKDTHVHGAFEFSDGIDMQLYTALGSSAGDNSTDELGVTADDDEMMGVITKDEAGDSAVLKVMSDDLFVFFSDFFGDEIGS